MGVNKTVGKSSLERIEKAKNENISQQGCQNYLCPVNLWVTQIIECSGEMLPPGGYLCTVHFHKRRILFMFKS